jgi:PAS domain S-box-containing protein
VVTTVDGLIQNRNAAFNRLFGSNVEGVTSLSLFELIEKDDHHIFKTALETVNNSENSTRIEVRAHRCDKTSFHADIAFSALHDMNQHTTEIVLSIRDITERKRIEESLRQTIEKERELNDLKSQFVTTASHDFRTPLAVILSSIGLLELYVEKAVPGSKNKHFGKIRTAVNQMTELLDDILLFSKGQNQRLEVCRSTINLHDFCLHIVEEMNAMSNESHRIIFTNETSCPVVLVDDKLLYQILNNILTNAIKYSPAGSDVNIDVACGDTAIIFVIKDRGIGIPENELKRLFEPFHRASNVGAISGTGLGLPIAQKAAELLGGTIQCQSALGVGTTFTVSIPLSQEQIS